MFFMFSVFFKWFLVVWLVGSGILTSKIAEVGQLPIFSCLVTNLLESYKLHRSLWGLSGI